MHSSVKNDPPHMRVTAIVPCYNARHSISAAIRSIAEQTYPVAEIIAIDDGSTDGTHRKLDELRTTNRTLKVLRQENAGPANARNNAIQATSTPWVAFLDADDEWLPRKLEAQLAVAHDYPNLSWIGGAFFREDSETGRLTKRSFPGPRNLTERSSGTLPALALLSRRQVPIWTGTILAKKTAIDTAGGFPETLRAGEDSLLWTRMALAYPKIGYTNQPVSLYRVSQPTSLVGTNARQIDTTQFEHYSTLLELSRSSGSPTSQRLLTQILSEKINGYTRGLIRTGNTRLARKFLSQLETRNLPTASPILRAASLIPQPIARQARLILRLPKQVICRITR